MTFAEGTGCDEHRNEVVIGLDTSAYTTSVAVVSLDGRLIADVRTVLSVPAGRRGLRQSEAVFQHVGNLPELLEQAAAAAGKPPVAIAASVAPRSHPDSYMPVFRVGHGAARALAAWQRVPFVPVSHQDGHVWAGLWSSDPPLEWVAVDDVIVMHASGGTTELFRATRSDGVEASWQVELLSASEDLYAGQFIDRTGVRLGLPFPAGPHLERLADEGDVTEAPLPIAVHGTRLSFSGPDAAAQRLTERGVPAAHVAAAVQQCVARSLARWAANVLTSAGIAATASPAQPSSGSKRRIQFLGVGGVMANGRLREELQTTLSQLGVACAFADRRYSIDNAVGVALAAAVHCRSKVDRTTT